MERALHIVVLDRSSVGEDVSVEPLKKYGEVTFHMTTKDEEAAERVKDADIIIVNKTPMNADTLDGASHLKLICEFATGFDNVDLDYCRKRGIPVVNVVNYSTAAVAQHTIACVLYILEKLRYYDDYVKSGAYGSQPRFSHFGLPYSELDGKTWGIVGMGNIGRKVAAIAEAFGCRVICFSASGRGGCTDYEQVDFETLLRESDVLTLHCPLSDRTRNLIDLEALKKMKKTAILVNVARGAVVNEADLCTALQENWIMGAGIDVLSREPIDPGNPLLQIQDSSRLLITPHMAWASVEARTRVVAETCRNIEAFLRGEARNVVNP